MSGKNEARRTVSWGFSLAGLCLVFSASASAGLVFAPTYDSSITSSANASQIIAAIQTATGNIEALYSNDVVIPVTFSYNPAGANNLLSTSQFVFDESYSDYESALITDYIQHPTNTVLGTAIANLSKGNDGNGANDLALTAGQINMLGIDSVDGGVAININSTADFSFSEPTSGSQFDLIGGLEHELNETMGGGGGGSTLNAIAQLCGNNPNNFFCDKYGALDLLRYSAPNTPSFTTSGSATSYLSVDGGVTSIVAFNQNSGGDFADFAPPGAGAGQLIQNAFNATGQDEAYTTSSPEFFMQEAIGWDNAAATPEPGTIALVCSGLALIGITRRRLA